MEEAAAVREAASDATADVEPDALRETIQGCVDDGSLVPGVLTLLSAGAVSDGRPENLSEQAAGVQLVYDGLRLTRRLAHDGPWTGDGGGWSAGAAPTSGDAGANEVAGKRGDTATDAGADRTTTDEGDMAVLAADVLVARGFYLLARTDAATDAVAVVRAFGRDQTERESATAEEARALDGNLEADVLELAVTTGVTATGRRVADAGSVAAHLAPAEPRFDPVDSFFDERTRDRLDGLLIDSGRPLNRND